VSENQNGIDDARLELPCKHAIIVKPPGRQKEPSDEAAKEAWFTTPAATSP
jgi:hypothetical protein